MNKINKKSKESKDMDIFKKFKSEQLKDIHNQIFEYEYQIMEIMEWDILPIMKKSIEKSKLEELFFKKQQLWTTIEILEEWNIQDRKF